VAKTKALRAEYVKGVCNFSENGFMPSDHFAALIQSRVVHQKLIGL